MKLDLSGMDGSALRPRPRAEAEALGEDAALGLGGLKSHLACTPLASSFAMPAVHDLDGFERSAIDMVKVCHKMA